MAESASARQEQQKVLIPTSPGLDDSTSSPPTASVGGPAEEGDLGEQSVAVAGPSRQRPLSGRSTRSQDAYELAADSPTAMGVPSIERFATPTSPTRGGSSRGIIQDDQEEQVGSRPGTGKWLQQRVTPTFRNSTQLSDPLLDSGRPHSRASRRSHTQAQDAPTSPQRPTARDGAIGRFHEGRMTGDNSPRYSQQANIPPSPTYWQSQESQPEPSKLATQLYIYAYLIFFAIFGTLARLGVQWITFYPGAPLVTDVTWANVGGSFVMGFLSEDRQLFSEEWGPSTEAVRRKNNLEVEDKEDRAFKKTHAKVKKTIPLYVGLATGFCGSFTSFSSFLRDVFLALSNDLPTPDNHPTPGIASPSFTSTVHRNGGYSFMALVAIMLYTVALSLGALFVGAHVATALDPWTPTLPFRFTRKVVDRVMLILGPGCWLGAVFLAIWPPDRPDGPDSRGTWSNEVWRGEVLFALVFAPLGCILRYLASQHLNGIISTFPLGTFAVNIFGCAVEAMCYDLQHVPLLSAGAGLIGGGRVGCQVLQGLMDGFCGCLTTVSTWVAELQSLRRRHAYVYGLVSLMVGLGIMVIIMGSVRWTVGWSDTACVTSRTSS